MTLSCVRKILDEARGASIETIYSEGCESFLYYPVLIQGVNEALRSGFQVGIAASCYWATSLEGAVAWLEPLRSISGLELSGDEYHRSVENTRFGVIAAKLLGIPMSITSISASHEPEEIEGIHINHCAFIYRGRATSKLASHAEKRSWTCRSCRIMFTS